MSSVTDIVQVPAGGSVAAPRARRGRRALAVVFGLVALLVVAGGGGAAALSAWDAGYEGRVLPGVHAGGVDLSGMTRAEATAALATAWPFGAGRLVLRTPDGDVAIPYASVSRRPATDAVVDQALAAGRIGTPVERAIGEVRQALDGVDIATPAVVFDEKALRDAVQDVVLPLRAHPVSATISMTSAGPVYTRARTGRDADPEPVVAAALAALADPATPAEVVLPVATARLQPRVDDRAILAARDAAVRMTRPVRVTTKNHHWTIRTGVVRSWIRFAPAPGGQVVAVVDASRVPASLKAAAKAVRKPAKNAEYLVSRSGRIVGVVASSAGRGIDRAGTTEAIVAELEQRAAGAAAASVKVVTKAIAPTLRTDEAARKAPVMSLLGSWQTWFPISDHNFFGANIWVPARLINGTVLKPGQRFDWWDAILPVSPARGFGPGGFIAGDHTEPTGALGGGMCSSSTTLFNAAMRAGLEIDARSNHKYYIPRYPLGLDATVSISAGGRQTMSFRNDTNGPIFIRGIRIPGGRIGWVRYEIWGVPDGRTVSLSRASVANLQKATTKTVLVDTLPKGQREQVEYPSDRMTTSVSRIVRDAHGRVIHRDTWVSHYVLWNGLIQVGR